MKRISRNISIVLRTERMIAQRQMALMIRQTGLYAFAGLVSLIALVMLNMALFYALESRLSPHWAAFLVALGNAVLAILLVLVAGRVKPGAELEPVTELRDLAMAEIETDVEGVVEEARDLSRNVRRIARDPFGSALPTLLGHLLSILLSGRKK